MTFSQVKSKCFLGRLTIVKGTVEGREMAGAFRGLGPSTAELGWVTVVRPAGRNLSAF